VFFSIVIPTYNRADRLLKCLKSLVDQTFKDFEVIVCDDGSTDHTKAIIAQFANSLNIKYIYSDNWGGPAKPRNIGLKEASGEWTCFLDSDDWWKASKLEEVKKKISKDYNIYYHPLQIVNSQKELGVIKCRRVNNKSPKLDLLVNLNTLLTSSVCIESELLKKSQGFSLDKSVIGLEDYKFWIDLGGIGGAFKRINMCLGYYFVGDSDSITLEDERQIRRFEQLYDPYLNDPVLIKSRGRIIGSLNFHTGRIIQDANLNKSYKQYLFKAFLMGGVRVKLMALKRLIKL